LTDILTTAWFWWIALPGAALILIWFGSGFWLWLAVGAPALLAFSFLAGAGTWIDILIWTLAAVAYLTLGVPAVRMRLLTGRIMRLMRERTPSISPLEKQALDAGGQGWEKELFAGRPVWRRLRRIAAPKLDEREIAFLEGPVETFCGLVNDYRLNNQDRDLPPQAWQLLREERFFGMGIPEAFGGLDISPCAQAAAIMKIASRSISAALTVMIPNSLGPARLILKYGTEEQKRDYLPRLASGEEVPCFALTGPEAGSDAAAIPDRGVVCHGAWRGRQDVLGVRISFDKRYVSLGPVATLIGVPFKLFDPDGFLGDEAKLGITIALIPADAPGVERGPRHDPLQLGFHNGPVRGEGVFVPMDCIIGGPEGAGRGWAMLMESLTDDRAVSLPALSCAAGKMATRITGAYARVRYQFHKPIARFEGVQEALAGIAGHTFAMEGARQLILAEIDAGAQPAVAASIVKYNLTDRCRKVLNLAMDVHGGAGLMLGPRNLIGEFYKFSPIGVTAEGANILTRSLITFGQGMLRCHPFLKREMDALEAPRDRSAREFDRAFAGHLRHVARNLLRTLVHGLTGARLAAVPARSRHRSAYRQIARLSSAFALMADVLLFRLRDSVRTSERLSGRMADVLSQMYIASGALRLLEQIGRDDSMDDLKHWVLADSLWRAQMAIVEICRNLPGRVLGRCMRFIIFPLGNPWTRPSDKLDRRLAEMISVPSTGRDRLTAGIYMPTEAAEPLSRLETALRKVTATAPLAAKLREGELMDLVAEGPFDARVESAVTARLMSPEEAQDLITAERARLEALRVDAY